VRCFHTFEHLHLGDTWRSVCALMQLSQQLGEPVGFQYLYDGKSIEHYVRSIPPEIDSTGTIVPVPTAADAEFLDVVHRWLPSVPTKRKWGGRTPTRRRLTCHFDGVACAERKLPPPEDMELFLQTVRRLDFDVYVVNGKEPFHELIERMASSDLFVGVCSGPTQIAYSVGVPVVLCKQTQWDSTMSVWHGPKPLVVSKNLKHLTEQTDRHVGPLWYGKQVWDGKSSWKGKGIKG
jgi:hypothetical protein